MKKDKEINEQELMDKVNQTFDEMVEDVKHMVHDGSEKDK